MTDLRRTLAVSFAAAVFALSANATTITGSLYYTTFQNQGGGGTNNVFKVPWTYNDVTPAFSFGTSTALANLLGADGIIFAPNGNLLVGGQQSGTVYELTTTGTVVSSFAGGAATGIGGVNGAFHLSRDTHGTVSGLDMYVSPGYNVAAGANLGHMTLAGGGGLTGAGTTATGSGAINSLEWVPASSGGPLVFFTQGSFTGLGSAFGTVNTTTWARSYICGGTTGPDCSSHPAHSAAWDPFTKTLIVWGAGTISQYDPATSSWLPGTMTLSGVQLDMGEADGLGHLFIADNATGRVLFMDLTSGNVGAPKYVTSMTGGSANFLGGELDDLVVPTAPVPEPNMTVLLGGALIAVGWIGRRRSQLKAKQ